MINIVMTVKDRPRLTAQALRSLALNTVGDWNLTIVDDQGLYETLCVLNLFFRSRPKQVAILRNHTSKGITGQVRNLGVYWAERYWGRGDWLYLSDNDVFFTPDWDMRLIDARLNFGREFPLIGGQNHPYHQPVTERISDSSPHYGKLILREYLALAGTSWLMRWDTWGLYGPLDAHAPGLCQSEDHAFCQKIREAGGKVGALDPPVVIDCSLTNTFGKPAIGAELKKRVEGVLYE